MADTVKLSIITSNVRGIREYQKQKYLFHHFHKLNSQIFFLQECHSSISDENTWSTQWGSHIWFSHGETNARGVAILIKKKCNIQIHNVLNDSQGRYIMLYCTYNGHKFLLVNVYAPNKDDPGFFSKLTKDIARFTPEFHIIAGNFNLVLDPSIDKHGQSETTFNKSATVIKELMNTQELIDI